MPRKSEVLRSARPHLSHNCLRIKVHLWRGTHTSVLKELRIIHGVAFVATVLSTYLEVFDVLG